MITASPLRMLIPHLLFALNSSEPSYFPSSATLFVLG